MNPHLLAASLGMPVKAAPKAAPKKKKSGVASHLALIKQHHAAGNHKAAKVSALNLAKLLGGMQSGAQPPVSPAVPADPSSLPPAA